jgi:adenine-specific DNA-methyltransferase
MIKYLGSKRTLLPQIGSVMNELKGIHSIVDLFSGTSRVGHYLKGLGYQVFSNDHNAYAATLARCYVQADKEEVEKHVKKILDELAFLTPKAGYFTETFCIKSRFFMPKNGERIDAMRERIQQLSLDPELEAVVLVSLMEAADRVDSTTGVQMAYLKSWAPRASNQIELRIPAVLSQARHGKGKAYQFDAEEMLSRVQADVVYMDPPYNQHKYLGNYHIWESLVLWDKPEVYGTACKRMDCKERSSAFNSKQLAYDAMDNIIQKAKANYIVVSFNNEGYFAKETIESMLSKRGEVTILEHDFKRYVGAQIGIYNPSGEKVGQVSHLNNKEYLYIVATNGSSVEKLSKLSPPVQLSIPLHSITQTQTVPSETAFEGELSRLSDYLEHKKHTNSSEAQISLGIDAARLRELFQALLSKGTIYTTGQRRGTVYHWSVSSSSVPVQSMLFPISTSHGNSSA